MSVEDFSTFNFNETAKGSVRLSVSEFRGRKSVDLRNWFFNEKGESCPTQKGAQVPLSELNRLIECLKTLQDELGVAGEL